MTSKERGRIIAGGAGGFLCPPEHPMHTYRVETDLRKRPSNRGFMCLESAVNAEWLDDNTRKQAADMLAQYAANKPALDTPEVQDWVHNVLGYFRNCYLDPDVGRLRDASALIIDNERDPMAYVDDHRGVDYVREHYPDYVPTQADFDAAYWGKKPE